MKKLIPVLSLLFVSLVAGSCTRAQEENNRREAEKAQFYG